MAKRETLKSQLKKAAKKRLNRKASGVSDTDSAATVDGATQFPVAGNSAGFPSKSPTVNSLDILIDALLALDRTRDDLNDRALMVGLKSVLRGYAGNEPGSAAVYEAVVEARRAGDLQPRPLRMAIDQLLEIVMAYGSDRDTPRAALTYLHSITS